MQINNFKSEFGDIGFQGLHFENKLFQFFITSENWPNGSESEQKKAIALCSKLINDQISVKQLNTIFHADMSGDYFNEDLNLLLSLCHEAWESICSLDPGANSIGGGINYYFVKL